MFVGSWVPCVVPQQWVRPPPAPVEGDFRLPCFLICLIQCLIVTAIADSASNANSGEESEDDLSIVASDDELVDSSEVESNFGRDSIRAQS